MRDRLPEHHEPILSGLPEVRAHFEAAAKRSPCHAPILDSIVRDLDIAERRLSTATEAQKPHIAEEAKANLAMAHMGLHYYPNLEGDFERAVMIFDSYAQKAPAAQSPAPKAPGF